MDLTRLAQINKEKQQAEADTLKHNQLLLDNIQTQEVIVKSFATLVDFLEKRTSKTEVVNQLTEIGTPDAMKVVSALDSLHDTVKQHKNTDLTEITTVMRGVLEEAKKIPKETVQIPKYEQKDYVAQFNDLSKSIALVEKAIKAQELKAEAPVVTVEAPVVNVEKPDLKPLDTSITKNSKEVVKAVKGINIPEFKTDTIEKLLKKTNKLLEELPDYMPSGGGGGGSSWVAVNTAGTPIPIQLESNGAIPVSTATVNYKVLIDDTSTANVTYVGKAAIGSATSSAVWQIQKIDETTGLSITWAKAGAFTAKWTEILTETYT